MTLGERITLLTDHVARAQSIGSPNGCWVGDKTAEGRMRRDVDTGRHAMRSAAARLRAARVALDTGDVQLADWLYQEADALVVIAMRAGAGCWDPTETRGRTVSRRNEAFAVLVDEKLAATGENKRGDLSKACRVVLAENHRLREQFFGATEDSLRKAYRRGK